MLGTTGPGKCGSVPGPGLCNCGSTHPSQGHPKGTPRAIQWKIFITLQLALRSNDEINFIFMDRNNSISMSNVHSSNIS